MDDRRPDDRDRDVTRPTGGARAARRPRTASACARLAADYVAEMTGKEPEGVTGVEHTEGGGWLVDVEVVETRRIPDSTDILAVYEAELDADGELLAYRRVKRYTRCQVGEA